ncbi:unnamed protein product, partial [Effrenium voratum]
TSRFWHLEQLLVEGSAFKKVSRLDTDKLKSTDTSGVKLLVTTLGGSWGKTDLEERYEYFEKALYQTIQKSDESNNSYLARHDANFEELLARSTTLEEVRAYVLLRQSNLNPEDKKKIVVEQSGKLQYEPVAKAVRFLGSRFFQEFQGGRQPQSKTRIYDVNFTEGPEEPTLGSSGAERAFAAQNQSQDEVEPELDAEFIEVMVAQEDQDALMVAGFENELEELFQDVPSARHVASGQSKAVEKERALQALSKARAKASVNSFWHALQGATVGYVAKEAIGEKKESANVAMSATVASDNEVDEVFEEQDLPEVTLDEFLDHLDPTIVAQIKRSERLSSQPPDPCSIASHNMMMNALKSVSEGVLKVLTMLLQIMMNYMEEGDQEGVEAKLEQMAAELQTQRTILQELAHHQVRRPDSPTGQPQVRGQPASRAKAAMPPSRPPAAPSMPMERVERIPDNRSEASHQSWLMAEEETQERIAPNNLELVPVQEPRHPPSLVEWGARRFTWGKKHKGSTYDQVYRTDPGYITWSQSRCQSLPPEQKDFVDYCSTRDRLGDP